MKIKIKVPSPGESVTEMELGRWLVEDGEYVDKDQEIAEIESDKATLPLIAEASGIISIKMETGTSLRADDIACIIETEHEAVKPDPGDKKTGHSGPEKKKTSPSATEKKKTSPSETENEKTGKSADTANGRDSKLKISPLARKVMREKGVSEQDIKKGTTRIKRKDVELIAGREEEKNTGDTSKDNYTQNDIRGNRISRSELRTKISLLRRNLGDRLVKAKNETAMLTTFNEVDMSGIISLRKEYMDKQGIKPGYISFFIKAATEALQQYPLINSFIDGNEIVTPEYYDIGIAVQTEKGLMVPVIRNTQSLSIPELERSVSQMAEKASDNKISIEEMTGGTFTITNGGVFGSLLSTPIINSPQSAILGMHNIVERPVAVKGKVEIRPMMYLALSYDHRVIDGRDSVRFLVKIKEIIENKFKFL